MKLQYLILSFILVLSTSTYSQQKKNATADIKKIEIRANSRDMKSTVRDNNHKAKVTARKRAMMQQKRAMQQKRMKQQTRQRTKMNKTKMRQKRQMMQRRNMNR